MASGPLADINVRRLLALPLSEAVLGDPITVGELYAMNGYRLLGVLASAGRRDLDAAMKKFTTVLKIDPAAGFASATPLGYDDHLPADEAGDAAGRLRDAAAQVRGGLFWPHALPDGMKLGRLPHPFTAVETLRDLSAGLKTAADDDRPLLRHALAVATHSAALAAEVAHATGGGVWPEHLWNKGLAFWAEVAADDAFWEHLNRRVDDLDDLSVRREDVAGVREKLPRLLLGLNAALALRYAAAGHPELGFRHLRVVIKSAFDQGTREQVVIDAVKKVVDERLEPLTRTVREKLQGVSGRIGRRAFADVCEPLMEDARKLCALLTDELHLSAGLLGRTEFDPFCAAVFQAAEQKIDYATDDRGPSLTYALVLTRRLLALPLSAVKRRELEQSLRRDAQLLYPDFTLPDDFNPTACYFVDGQAADPDSCLQLPVYKVTKVEGGSVSYTQQRALVPRSAAAARLHAGTAKPEDLKPTDAKGKALHEQYAKGAAEADAAVREIERQRDADLKAEQDRHVARLSAYNATVAVQEDRDQAEEDAITARRDDELAAERKEAQAERERVNRKHAMRVDPAKEHERKVTAWAKGPASAFMLEVPMGVLALVVFVLLGLATERGGRGSDGIHPLLIPGGGVLMLTVIGVGQGVRKYRLREATRRRTEAEAEQKADLDDLATDARKAEERVTADADRRAKPYRARLAPVAAHRDALRKQADAAVAAVRAKADAAARAVTNKSDAALKPVRDQLLKLLNPRDESHKWQFPPYLAWKADGFKDGEKPSQDEVNRLAQPDTSFLDELLLELLRRRLPANTYSVFVSNLKTLPPDVRRQVLAELRRKMGL